MGKASFPYKVTNNMESFVRLKQAELIKSNGKATLSDVYADAAKFCGVQPQTVSMIKSGSYNPSIVLAFLLAQFFETTVDGLFGIAPIPDGVE